MTQVPDLSGMTVLVTGASGFLGSRLVALLSEKGCSVRALVRKTSRTDHLRLPNVTIFHGDVTAPESMIAACSGAGYIVHAAADTVGTGRGRRVTIEGTKNILELSSSCRVKKLVYISSCSVYGVSACHDGRLIDETAPLEQAPERRGAYSHAKLEAEKLVTGFMQQERLPVVCLRPGAIYGPGGAAYMPMIGFSFRDRVFAVIGNGESVLPLVYIDNLVAAIVLSLTSDKSNGQVYNVVDPGPVHKKRYMDEVIRRLYPRSSCFYVPNRLLYVLVLVQEKLFSALRRKPLLTRYRLSASQMPVVYDATKIMKELGWHPVVSFDEAVTNLIEYEAQFAVGGTECAESTE